VNRALRGDQIEAALERHGLSEATIDEIKGIHYDGSGPGPHPHVTITVIVAGRAKVLVVPDDVFDLPTPARPGERRRLHLFD